MRALHITDRRREIAVTSHDDDEKYADGACPRQLPCSHCLLDDACAIAIRRRSHSNRIATRLARDVLIGTSKEALMKTMKKGKLNLQRESLVELDTKSLEAANGGVASKSWFPTSCLSADGGNSCGCITITK
jgi:hypothetical protein